VPVRVVTGGLEEPGFDPQIHRGVLTVSGEAWTVWWTSDGRGGGRRGSPARVPPPQTGLPSAIGSPRRPELTNQAESSWGVGAAGGREFESSLPRFSWTFDERVMDAPWTPPFVRVRVEGDTGIPTAASTRR
jgi:hypothetical protein